jgi:ATP-dependent RNA helicase RhlE
MGKAIPQEKLEGYAPKVTVTQKGARKNPKEHKNTDGAFGKKKETKTAPKSKKRKTTKRDGFKAFDAAKPKTDKKDKKRGRGRR